MAVFLIVFDFFYSTCYQIRFFLKIALAMYNDWRYTDAEHVQQDRRGKDGIQTGMAQEYEQQRKHGRAYSEWIVRSACEVSGRDRSQQNRDHKRSASEVSSVVRRERRSGRVIDGTAAGGSVAVLKAKKDPARKRLSLRGKHGFWCTIRDSNPGHPD